MATRKDSDPTVPRNLFRIGERMELDLTTIHRAAIVYHKFNAEIKVVVPSYFLNALAAASLSLCSKAAGSDVDLEILTHMFDEIVYERKLDITQPDDKYNMLLDQIKTMEAYLIRFIQFEFVKDTPMHYLLLFMDPVLRLVVPERGSQESRLKETALALMNDLFLSKLCIAFDAEVLAVTVLYFTLLIYGISFPGSGLFTMEWTEVLGVKVTDKTIFTIINEMVDIYDE